MIAAVISVAPIRQYSVIAVLYLRCAYTEFRIMQAEKSAVQNMIVDIRIRTVPVEEVVAPGKASVILREVAFRTEVELVATRLLTIAQTFRQVAMFINSVSLAEVELVAPLATQTEMAKMMPVRFHLNVPLTSSAGQEAADLRVTWIMIVNSLVIMR
jgi:hypothetical protein